MIYQENRKYNSKEHGTTVRFTNQKFSVQVVHATNLGDKIMSQATSAEPSRYDAKTALKNNSVPDLTGVLAAQRASNKFGFDETFKGYDEAGGEKCHVEDEGDNAQSPFKRHHEVLWVHSCRGQRFRGELLRCRGSGTASLKATCSHGYAAGGRSHPQRSPVAKIIETDVEALTARLRAAGG